MIWFADVQETLALSKDKETWQLSGSAQDVSTTVL